MKTALTLYIILVCVHTGFTQDNSSRIIARSGMPSRIPMNVTIPKQQRIAPADTSRNPLYGQGGTTGQNPLFESSHRATPVPSREGPTKKDAKKDPAGNPSNGLKDVVKTQV
ncbi:MAG: hypothetical protein J7599_22475 [Niabella sp.]|nr:hypothetical protein [Niabella sp.]